jgi:outer membrane protein assembly factor BamA
MVVTASPSAGTWNYTTGTGLNIAFTLNCGSTFQTTAGSWQTGNFLGTSNSMNLTASVNDYLQISQVNLIMNSSPYSGLGTVLPMIQPISYKDDLARCQRYFNTYSGSPIGISLNGGRTYNDGVLYFPTEMRSSPSLQSGASYSVNAGVPGTVSAGTNTKIAELTNSDNNWTANAIVSFTGSFSADF